MAIELRYEDWLSAGEMTKDLTARQTMGVHPVVPFREAMDSALKDVLNAYRETGTASIEYKNAVDELNRAEDEMLVFWENYDNHGIYFDPWLACLDQMAGAYRKQEADLIEVAMDRYGQPSHIENGDVSGYFASAVQCANKYMAELHGGESDINMEITDMGRNSVSVGFCDENGKCVLSGSNINIDDRNLSIMEAVDAMQHSENYMPYAKTQYDVRVRLPETGTKVRNYLENAEYETNDKKEFVIKGTVDETWVIDSGKLGKTYAFADGTPFSKDEFLRRAEERPDEYQTLTTIADGNAPLVYACQLPPEVENFPVQTSWGDTLYANSPGVKHGEGDYIVAASDDNGQPDFNDMWVVNGLVFETTYEPANDRELGDACLDGADEEDLSDIMEAAEDEEDFCM